MKAEDVADVRFRWRDCGASPHIQMHIDADGLLWIDITPAYTADEAIALTKARVNARVKAAKKSAA